MVKAWNTVQVPLAAGLDTKTDPRARTVPLFEILRDAEFELVGGLQTRKPFGTLGTSIVGGGTLSNIRRIVDNAGELLAFTSAGLYSYSLSDAGWVYKGEHLAVKVEEAARFTTTGDQVDADRAELNGHVIVTWHEVRGGGTYGYVAAYDSTTGAVTMAPRELVGFQRIRLVALSTKILLSYYDGITGYYVYALDPASPATALAGASTTIVSSNGTYYDVAKVPGQDLAVYACTRNGGGSYELVTFTSSLTKTNTSKAAAVGVIAIAAAPNGTHVQVVRRSSSTTIHGDYVAISGFTTVNSNTAIATTSTDPTQLSCAYRSVLTGGSYRCYVFWPEGTGPTIPGTSNPPINASHTYGSHVYSNWIDTTAAVGTAAKFVALVDVNSRAFDYNGQVYLWLGFSLNASIRRRDETVPATPDTAFTYAPQSSYFLYRDDGILCAKSVMLAAGGAPTKSGWLPNVQALSSTSFAWAGTKRRAIEFVGDDNRTRNDYAARAPHEITTTFDSNEARRCVRLGRTLYITGGEVLQYDGVQLTEVGFHVLPYVNEADIAGGDITPFATRAWKWGPRWLNAAGDVDFGSTPSILTYLSATAKGVTLWTYPLTVTHKTNRPIALEAWRTAGDPTADASFYRVTSKDPAATGTNGYISNDTTAAALVSLDDFIDDPDLLPREQYPLNGGELENLAPPAATIAIATADRVFLAGVAGDPNRVWYSKQRRDGQVAAFNGRLTVALPSYAAAITGLGIVNETVIAFTSTAAYALDGRGYDNTAGGTNYGPARELATDVGALAHESIASTPAGLVFKSAKGWYLLNRGWALQYIGAPVASYDAEDVLAVHVVESQHQVRILTASRMLVWDYNLNQWAEWTVASAVGAAMSGGVHHVATASDVKAQRSDYTGIDYGIEAKLAPIKLNDLQGAGSVRWLSLLGEYRGVHQLQVQLYRDYQASSYQTVTWTPSPTTIGGPLQVSIGPSIPKCEAIGVHIKVLSSSGTWSEALRLTGLALDVGIDRGLNRRLPAAQKA